MQTSTTPQTFFKGLGALRPSWTQAKLLAFLPAIYSELIYHYIKTTSLNIEDMKKTLAFN